MKKILALLIFTNIIYAQNKIHITIDEFNKMSREIIQDNSSDTAHIKILIQKLEKADNKAIQAYASIAKAFSYKNDFDLNKFEKNTANARLLLLEAKQDNFTKKIKSSLLNFEGVFFQLNNDNDKALFKFIEARDLAFEAKDYNTMIGIDSNVSKVYRSIGNLDKGILIIKKNLTNIEKYSSFIDKKNRKYKLCLNYADLGDLYNQKYKIKKNVKFLDSAINIYQKAVLYQVPNLRADLNINIGNLFLSKREFEKAKFYFLSIESDVKADVLTYTTLQLNIAYVNFEIKDYKSSLKNCKIIDSIYNSKKIGVVNEYVFSNYLQSKIYEKLNNKNKMLYHSKIHLEYEKNLKKDINDESEVINSMMKYIDKDKEFEALSEKKYLKIDFIILIIVIANIVLFFVLYKKFKSRIKTNFNYSKNERREIPIDIEKENKILSQIIELENQHFYLNVNFNQKELAKKINTNTTYISYIFNKNFNTSFNSYYNDLRINYAIEEMKNNKQFREFSTQAIAETVGFKNVDSFTHSFKKKTGKTPFQFINYIKESKS